MFWCLMTDIAVSYALGGENILILINRLSQRTRGLKEIDVFKEGTRM